jgi:hypothetical protein
VNRPYWLDILHVYCFLVPPVAIAATLTAAVARRLEWSGLAWLLAYLVALVVCLALWLAGLVVWPCRGGTGEQQRPK